MGVGIVPLVMILWCFLPIVLTLMPGGGGVGGGGKRMWIGGEATGQGSSSLNSDHFNQTHPHLDEESDHQNSRLFP